MSTLENIVPRVEFCKLIPAGEFEDSALARYNFHGVPILRWRDNLEKLDGVRPIPAPTLDEIRRKLRNLSIVPGDDVIHVECKIDPENWVSTIAVNDNDVTAAALRLWFKVKGIEIEI